MTGKIVAAIAALFAFFGINILKTKRDKDAGKIEAERDAAEEQLDDIHKANKIRDRLDSDPEYAKRVRDRFTR